MESTSWLNAGLVYLAAAVIAVPLARLVGLGSIIGYLVAGIVIGPWGLRFVTDPQDMLHFAEFGVVLMLFLVGMELEPDRLWALRKPIFGWGSVQLFGSVAVLAGDRAALRRRVAARAGGRASASPCRRRRSRSACSANATCEAPRPGRASSASRCCRTSRRSRCSRCCRCSAR